MRHPVSSSSIQDVYFTILSQSGDVLVPETQVFDDVGSLGRPRVAANADGTFAVVFRDDTSGGILRFRAYDSIGNFNGSEDISTGIIKGQDIASLGDGRFIVTWVNATDDMKAQILDNAGNEVGPEIDVDTHASRQYSDPKVVELADGNFLVTTMDPNFENIHGRIYASDGTALTLMLTLTSAIGGYDVAALPDGRFVLTWDTFGGEILARVYNADGAANDVAFPVDAAVGGSQADPTITVYADGRFMIAWEDGAGGLDAAVFDPREAGVDLAGSAFGDEFVGTAFTDTMFGGEGMDMLYGEGGADVLRGGAKGDSLNGGLGNDLLDGGAGADLMVGAGGNDTYIVDHAADTITELNGGGRDLVQASASYALATNVENLTLTGSGAINGSGNTRGNTITGNSGANVLSGLNGNDKLSGRLGADTLNGGNGHDRMTGGASSDIFVFNAIVVAANSDTIVDFTHTFDKIHLDNAVFAGIGTNGALAGARFFSGAAAHDATDRIIYNPANGQLTYDADGNGVGASILVAKLETGLTVTASDFQVI